MCMFAWVAVCVLRMPLFCCYCLYYCFCLNVWHCSITAYWYRHWVLALFGNRSVLHEFCVKLPLMLLCHQFWIHWCRDEWTGYRQHITRWSYAWKLPTFDWEAIVICNEHTKVTFASEGKDRRQAGVAACCGNDASNHWLGINSISRDSAHMASLGWKVKIYDHGNHQDNYSLMGVSVLLAVVLLIKSSRLLLNPLQSQFSSTMVMH